MTEMIRDEKQKAVDIKSIFRQTYYYSQGYPALQNRLFEWLGVKNFVNLDDTKNIPDWMESFFHPRHHYNSEQVHQIADAKKSWGKLHEIIRGQMVSVSNTAEFLANQILNGMVSCDVLYQIKSRPNRQEINFVSDGENDQHKSFVRKYVIGQKHLVPPFNLLFETLRSDLKNIQPSSEIELERIIVPNKDSKREDVFNWAVYELRSTELKLGMLSKLWEQNHPGEKFFDDK